jgi:hypothetical protein
MLRAGEAGVSKHEAGAHRQSDQLLRIFSIAFPLASSSISLSR